MANDEERETAEPWYMEEGRDTDVAVSTRARLARNLASFPFPAESKADELERERETIFDAIKKIDGARFHLMAADSIDGCGEKILRERGILTGQRASGVAVSEDGRVSCMVNETDHARIASFVAGIAFERAARECISMDSCLQRRLQFAASDDFGFLTARLKDAGSGMKLSLRVHLPSISFCGGIPELAERLKEEGASLSSAFGPGDGVSLALGSFYEIATTGSLNGSEIDQIASMESASRRAIEMERDAREKCARSRMTEIHNVILRAYALARFSLFLGARESIETISAMKWGVDIGCLTGAKDNDLAGLLYRTRDGHLEFLSRDSRFSFEKDVAGNGDLRKKRLRALVFQSALENVNFAK